MLKKILITLITFSYFIIFSQGTVCYDPAGLNGATPFCTISGVEFANSNYSNSSFGTSAELGPDYSCLFSQPYPAWYYLKIGSPGNLTLSLIQTSLPDGAGIPLDVDFICYGPFPDPETPCSNQLTLSNTVDCSFSLSYSETINITNALEGEYYMVLITNYSGQPGYISLNLISGPGTTDCSIIDAQLGPDIDQCGFEPIILDASDDEAISYNWFYLNEISSNFEVITGANNPTLNITNSGTYMVEIVDSEGDTSTDEVIISMYEEPEIHEVPESLFECDDNGDGTTEFDLTNNEILILGTQDPLNFSISFHNTQEDAQNNLNNIGTTANLSTQEVFARIENNNNSECYQITSFNVTVLSNPSLIENQLFYKSCEVYDTTPNLGNVNTDEILQSLYNINDEAVTISNETDLNHLFFNSVADAEMNQSAISGNMTFNNGDSLFVRVENTNNCYSIAEITLENYQYPQIIDKEEKSILKCPLDDYLSYTSEFDLTIFESDLLDQNSLTSEIKYFANESDLNLRNEISNPLVFTNTENPQYIYAAIYDTLGFCNNYDTIQIKLEVASFTPIDTSLFGELNPGYCVTNIQQIESNLLLGYEIPLGNGDNKYYYDWTPDNSIDSSGYEQAIWNISDISQIHDEYELVITQEITLENGQFCSYALPPIYYNPEPSYSPTNLTYSLDEELFSSNYTVNLIPILNENNNTGHIEYSIDNIEYQDSNIFENIPPGEWTFYARNKYGCGSEVHVNLQILDYPHVFTPNGDGINDIWNILDTTINQNTRITIYDRYGNILDQIYSFSEGWNGQLKNGILAPSDDYWFIANYLDPQSGEFKSFTASFTLKRK